MGLVARFDVYWVNLDPVVGAEIKKTRPCVIVSPNEMNQRLRTVIIAPLTSTIKHWPFRVNVQVGDRAGQVALDQIRTVDQTRLTKQHDTLPEAMAREITAKLQEMFAW